MGCTGSGFPLLALSLSSLLGHVQLLPNTRMSVCVGGGGGGGGGGRVLDGCGVGGMVNVEVSP